MKTTTLLKSLVLCAAAVLGAASTATTAATVANLAPTNPFPARWNTTQRGLILVPDEAHAMTTDLAVKRLRSKSPIRFDLVDGVRDNRTDPKNYDLTIILGVTGDNKELAQGWTGERPTNEDAWALKTISTNPLVIVATGNRPRAVLYAVWALADKIAAGEDVSAINMQETPRLDKRYAVVCGTAYGGFGFDTPVNRHTLYMATVDELPRYGINGVFLCPGDWRVAVGPGKIMPPLLIGKDGSITVDSTKLPEWRTMMGVLKSYDMDIIITVEPFVHPAFDAKKIEKEFIMGGKVPAGYLEALGPFYRDYLEKLISIFPDLDGLVLHAGVEGAQYAGGNATSIRMFLSEQNTDACVEAMKVYAKAVDDVTRRHNMKPVFWAHQWGINSEGMNAMRNMLFQFPRFVILEEDFWPNNLWINSDKLPIMAFLKPAMREELDKHGNKLGFLSLADAEYYGGGSLPAAIAGPYIYSMREILKRNSEMVIFRLNLHDRTPYGSLWAVNGIQIEQAANQLWDNPVPVQQVWDRWIKRTYGDKAAPLISKALANCEKIIYDGFTLKGMNIMHHSALISREWMPDWPAGEGKMKMLGKPGTPLLNKGDGDKIESLDQFAWQLHLRAMSFKEFTQLNRGAMDEVMKSLALIDQARPDLARADYACLHEIFDNARILLDVFYSMGEAAYATNLMKDNFDNVPDVKGYFEQAMRRLDERAASKEVQWLTTKRRHVYGDVAGELRKLAAAYRQFAGQTQTTK